jgi:hypothetical protein
MSEFQIHVLKKKESRVEVVILGHLEDWRC